MPGLGFGFGHGLMSRAGSPLLFRYSVGDDLARLGAIHTRSSTATSRDGNGLIQTDPNNVLRHWNWVRNPVNGFYIRTALLEDQGTNLSMGSVDFSNWLQFAADRNFVNGIPNPFGDTGAFWISEQGSDGMGVGHGIYRGSNSPGSIATGSVFLKAGGRNHGFLRFDGVYCYADLLTGQVVAENDSLIARSEAWPGGWWRVIATRPNYTGSNNDLFFGPGISLDGNSRTYGGDGSKGVYAARPQVEPGAFASSVIPTADSPVTRASDDLAFPIDFDPQPMSLFFRGIAYGSNTPFPRLIAIGGHYADGTAHIALSIPGGEVVGGWNPGVSPNGPAGRAFSPGDHIEAMLSSDNVSTQTFAASINGGAIGSGTAVVTPFPAFTEKFIRVGQHGQGFIAVRDLIVAKGQRDINWFRSLISP